MANWGMSIDFLLFWLVISWENVAAPHYGWSQRVVVLWGLYLRQHMDQHHCWLTSFGKGRIELFWVNEVVFELCVRGVESFLLMSILYLFNRQLLGREGNKVVSFLEFVCKFEPYFSVFFGEREVVQRWGFESGISVGDNRDKLCTGDRVMMQPRLYSRVPGQSSLRINSKQLVVDSKLIHLPWTLARLDECSSGETIKIYN